MTTRSTFSFGILAARNFSGILRAFWDGIANSFRQLHLFQVEFGGADLHSGEM